VVAGRHQLKGTGETRLRQREKYLYDFYHVPPITYSLSQFP